MDLTSYLSDRPRGFKSDFAKKLGISKSYLRQVETGYSAVVEAYNTVITETGASLPIVDDVQNLSDDRKKQIHELAKVFHKRFGDYSANVFANYFRDFMVQANARADKFYYGGLSGNGWKADFGYVMQEKTLDKTVENSL